MPADKGTAVESEPLAHTPEIKGNQAGSISKVPSHRDRDVTIQTAKQPRKKERYRRTCENEWGPRKTVCGQQVGTKIS